MNSIRPYPIKLNFCTIVDSSSHEYTTIFSVLFLHMFKGNKWHISSLKKIIIAFFSDSVIARSFKLCMMVALQWAGPLDLYGKEDAPALYESPSYGWNSWCQHGITGRISSWYEDKG